MTTIIAEKKHAVLGPSGWDRWSTCPGSVVLEEQFPNKTSSYAAWGTVAHEIAAECLTNGAEPEDYVGRTYKVEEHVIAVDMEMADCINDYIGHVCILVGEDDVRLVEQDVPIGHLTGETGAAGTADVIGIVNGGTRLIVIDFKTGRGVEVVAEGNGQGRMYALGALEKYSLLYDEITEVEVVIVQPRLDLVTSELLTVEQLREFADEVTMAAGAVELAVRGAAVGATNMSAEHLNPSEKACKFCRARSTCPALGAEISSSMALVSAADPAEFPDLSLPKQAASIVLSEETEAERLAAFMRASELIEGAIKAVRAEVERRLLAGIPVPGFKIVQGKAGRRQWVDPEAAEAELKKRFKVDEMYDKSVISPTQAEKLMKGKPRVWAKIVQTVGISKTEGKPSVAPESDPRPPMQLGAAPEDFPDLTVEALPAPQESDVEPLWSSHPELVANTEENIALRMKLAQETLSIGNLMDD